MDVMQVTEQHGCRIVHRGKPDQAVMQR